MATSPGNGITHALVEFADEGSSAVVPTCRLAGVDVMFLKEANM